MAVWQDNSKREARALAAAKLTLPKTWRDAIAQATLLASKKELPGLTLLSTEPLKLRPLNEMVEVRAPQPAAEERGRGLPAATTSIRTP